MLLTIASLLCLLLVARFCGVAAERFGQAAPVGELFAGILLALALLFVEPLNGFVAEVGAVSYLADIATLAIFFLVLQAGVELEPKEIFAASGGAFLVALGGVLLPLLLPVPLLSIVLVRLFDQITAIIGHSGYEHFAGATMRWPWLGICTVYHDQHH